MKKVLFLLFIILFNLSEARGSRLKLMEDVPWYLEYTYNKYGEEEKIISAQCGQWSMKNRVKITPEGIIIAYETGGFSGIKEQVKQISFLFDSKKEIIIKDVEEIEYDGVKIGKAFFIKKDNSKYSEIIKNIKKSNYMSIAIEDVSGDSDSITKIKNTDSYEILTTFENSLK